MNARPQPLRSISGALTLALCSCANPPATAPTDTKPPTTTTAAPTSPPATVSSVAPPPTVPSASAAPSPPDAGAPEPAVEAPLPKVKVANIGMHIGGGPHTAYAKEPIKRSVEPHFDALKRCYAHVDDLKKGGDFGIDLKIPREGGKAELGPIRSTIKNKPFADCVVEVFRGIEFLKPRTGTTTVSYSLRFTP